ncbi:MAG: ATPase, T2SS/T4P/T4SS family, partial [Clostridia bacterium]
SILNFVINRACSNSIYAFDSEIKRGYINLGNGYRMGVCGEAVTEKGEVSAIKNIASVNIRIPHEIRGCSDRIKHYIKEPISTLIIAPCGAGKTTILRDLAQSFGNYENPYAVTVIDERGEISGIGNGESAFKMNGCDIVSNCPKEYAFENVVRSMSPDVVITDEIFVKDRANLKMCVDSGVKVLASLHAENIEQATEKLGEDMKKIFDMYVILSKKVKIGEIKAIYNKNIEKIL